MRTRTWQKVLVWMVTLCLAIGSATTALATETAPAPTAATSDFEALGPIMDLVACTAMVVNPEQPEAVPGDEGTLSQAFVTALFGLWQKADPSLGLTQAVAGSAEQQAAFLGKVFAAKAPALQPVTQAPATEGFIGFCPMTVNTATEVGGIQLVGEMYRAEKPMSQMTAAEFQKVQWLDNPAIFTFQSDAKALNGFRLTGFSLGTDLKMEDAIQNYFEQISVEYVNTVLGFSVQYPGIFEDELLEEDAAGISAKMPDGSASFFAKRMDNVNHANLKDYVETIANGIPGAAAQIKDNLSYATVTYTAEGGFTVFDVFVVTDKYIYQAELSYRTELAKKFSLFNAYLENTFSVEGMSMG